MRLNFLRHGTLGFETFLETRVELAHMLHSVCFWRQNTDNSYRKVNSFRCSMFKCCCNVYAQFEERNPTFCRKEVQTVTSSSSIPHFRWKLWLTVFPCAVHPRPHVHSETHASCHLFGCSVHCNLLQTKEAEETCCCSVLCMSADKLGV